MGGKAKPQARGRATRIARLRAHEEALAGVSIPCPACNTSVDAVAYLDRRKTDGTMFAVCPGCRSRGKKPPVPGATPSPPELIAARELPPRELPPRELARAPQRKPSPAMPAPASVTSFDRESVVQSIARDLHRLGILSLEVEESGEYRVTTRERGRL